MECLLAMGVEVARMKADASTHNNTVTDKRKKTMRVSIGAAPIISGSGTDGMMKA